MAKWNKLINQRITSKFRNETIERFLKIIFFVYKKQMEIARRTHESKNSVKSNKEKRGETRVKIWKTFPGRKKWREGVVECKIPETVLERNKK